MNLSTLEHAAEALGIMMLVYLASYLLGHHNIFAGAMAGSFFFIGREHAQAEYRWIDLFGSGKRINLPWWGAFDKRVWTKLDSWFDWLAPTLACLGVAYLSVYVFGW